MANNKGIEQLMAEFDFVRKRFFMRSAIDSKLRDLEKEEASQLRKNVQNSKFERVWEFIHAIHLVGLITEKEYDEYVEIAQRLHYKEDYDENFKE